jgi:hypothetical protein
MNPKIDSILNLILSCVGLALILTSLAAFLFTNKLASIQLSQTDLFVFITFGIVITLSGAIFSELSKIKKHLGVK